MVFKYVSNVLRESRRIANYAIAPPLLALTIALSVACSGETTPTRYPVDIPGPRATPTATITPTATPRKTPTPTYTLTPTHTLTNTPIPTTSRPVITSTPQPSPISNFLKYTARPDERRLTSYMSREKIKEVVRNNITEVVVTDANENEDALDVGMFAESLGNTSFNFLAVKRLRASFYHPESGKCTETMERFDFDPPLTVQNFSPPYEPIGTSFLSMIKCEREWKETQTQWSNAAPLESFFTWVNRARPLHDLIFDKEGRQFILRIDGDLRSGYYINPPISRNE